MTRDVVRFFLSLCVVTLLFGLTAPLLWAKPDFLLKRGKTFVRLVSQKRFGQAQTMMSSPMKKAMGPTRLKMMWVGLELQLGPFERISAVKKTKIGSYTAVLVTTLMQKKSLVWRVILDQKGVVSGLQFQPGTLRKGSKKVVRIPPYAKRALFAERTVHVGKWKLLGTLSLPKAPGRKPAIVLVHGSGPHDQDETIGPNKIFRDLAWGLASQGVVVLRYFKRTKQLRQRLLKDKKLAASMASVEKEVIEDASAAVALLARTPGVDRSRIFVLGHSLGGLLAPAIAKVTPSMAGFISMAGASRALEDLVLDQFLYIFTSDGKVTAGERKVLNTLLQRIITLRSRDLTKPISPKKLPMHIPASYWLSLRRNDPIKLVKDIVKPMLFLQGGRDYQVTLTDLNLWKKVLKGRKNVTFKIYPSLNHLFHAGKGKSLPAEYMKPSFVYAKAITDIANWVKQVKLVSSESKTTTRPSPAR